MITSLQNPLIKQMRKLHRSKGRGEQNLFLIEGTHCLETALAVNCSLVAICYTLAWQSRYPHLWERAQKQAQRLELVSPEVLAASSTTVNPDGVIATAKPMSFPPITSLSLGLGLERIQDPGNLGTIIRTARATGVDGLWLSADSVEIDHPKVLRSSAGEWFRLPHYPGADLFSVVTGYQQQGVQIIATLPSATKTYWEIDFTRPTFFLLGNEGAGLSPHLASLADEMVNIPLMGGVESLNVAIATGLLLYEVWRQRRG